MLVRMMWMGVTALAVAGSVLMVYRVQPIPSAFANAWAALIWGAALLVWGGVTFGRKVWLQVSLAGWSWLAVLLWLLVQTRLTRPPYADALLFPVAALVLAWALHAMGGSMGNQRRRQIGDALALAWWVSSLGTVFLQTLQLTQSPWLLGFVMPLPEGMQPFGNLAQRNQAAFVHLVGMLAWAHLCAQHGSSRIFLRWGAMLLCLPMVWGLAMTSSRLFLFMGGLAWLASAWQLGLLGRNLSGAGAWARAVAVGLLLATAYAACYAGFTAAMPWLAPEVMFDNVVERLGNVSNQTRVVLQQQAWAMFTQSPLAGMGWGSFSAFALQWSDRSALPMFADHSHFLPSQWLAELGLVGLLVALPLIVLMVRLCIGAELWRRRFFLQSFVVATLLYSCSEFPLWEGYFLFPFALVLGLLEAERRDLLLAAGNGAGKTVNVSASWVALAGLLLLVGSLWSARTYLNLHFLGQKVFTGKPVEAQVFGEIANVPAFGYSAIKDVYLFVVLPVDRSDLQDKIAIGERVAGRFVDANVLQRLGFFYTLEGNLDRSKRLMQDACRFYPDKCGKVLSDLLTVPQTESDVFRQMHAELTQWWSNHPRNPARPPG